MGSTVLCELCSMDFYKELLLGSGLELSAVV